MVPVRAWLLGEAERSPFGSPRPAPGAVRNQDLITKQECCAREQWINRLFPRGLHCGNELLAALDEVRKLAETWGGWGK